MPMTTPAIRPVLLLLRQTLPLCRSILSINADSRTASHRHLKRPYSGGNSLFRRLMPTYHEQQCQFQDIAHSLLQENKQQGETMVLIFLLSRTSILWRVSKATPCLGLILGAMQTGLLTSTAPVATGTRCRLRSHRTTSLTTSWQWAQPGKGEMA